MVHSIVVTCKNNVDIDSLVAEIQRLKGVASTSTNTADVESHVAEERAKWMIREKILALIS